MKNEIKALAWMIPVGVLAFVLVALLDARLQPPAEHPMSVATACSPFDIACNAQEALDEQHGAGQSAAEEPVCREDGGNAYVCALPTEQGPIYVTAPSTCSAAPPSLDVVAQTRALIECTGDARAAVTAAAATYRPITWDESGLGGRAVWDLQEQRNS